MLIIAVLFATTCASSVKSIWNIAHRVCWPSYHLKILSTLKPANLVGFSTDRAGLKATSLWQSVGNSYMFHTHRHQSSSTTSRPCDTYCNIIHWLLSFFLCGFSHTNPSICTSIHTYRYRELNSLLLFCTVYACAPCTILQCRIIKGFLLDQSYIQ